MKKQRRKFCEENDIDEDEYDDYWWLRGGSIPEYDPSEAAYNKEEDDFL